MFNSSIALSFFFFFFFFFFKILRQSESIQVKIERHSVSTSISKGISLKLLFRSSILYSVNVVQFKNFHINKV